MEMDYSKLVDKKVKLVVVFSSSCDKPIFYEGIVKSYSMENKVLEIVDRFNKTVYLDASNIKQIVVI
jgi:hypothetical protein